MQNQNNRNCFIAIDTGTTNSRVWLLDGERITAFATAMVGVRDTAQTGNVTKLTQTLTELIAQVRQACPDLQPSCIAAAGMITSPLGLAEIPHLPAPAGLSELAKGSQRLSFPAICELPFFLFPGVRSGQNASESYWQSDVMRGEETLCLGLLADSALRPPFTLLNLGSHWKAILIDEQGRIQASRTSLTGELIFATQANTILASGLPKAKLETLDEGWFSQGLAEFERSGLPRALFCVRLLEMQGLTTADQRMAFLVGIYVAAELAGLRNTPFIQAASKILITGTSALAEAWQLSLRPLNLDIQSLSPETVERGFLRGISQLLQLTAS